MAFPHETKIIGEPAIKANDYSRTVTFIVLQLKTRTRWIRNKQRCNSVPRNAQVISAAININYTSTTKQMWEENMLWGCTLESSLVVLVLCKAIRIKTKRGWWGIKTHLSLRVHTFTEKSEQVEGPCWTKCCFVLKVKPTSGFNSELQRNLEILDDL